MKKPFEINIILTVILCYLTSCDSKQQNQQQKFTHHLQVVNPIFEKITLEKDFVGQTYGLSDIPIRARVEGFLDNIHFLEGREVKKGELLYTIDSEPYLADKAAKESKLAEAITRMTKSKNDLTRYIPLAKTNAVSQSDLDAVQAEYDASIASVNAAKAALDLAKIQLGYCQIKSPISGVIGKTQAKIGEFVGKNPNPVILNTVSNIDSVLVTFFLPEDQYLYLAKNYVKNKNQGINNKKVKDDLELVFSDNSIYNHRGKIDFIDRSINAQTGTILIQASFPNPDEILRPGLYIKVRIPFNNDEKVILIPQRCITEIQGVNNVLKLNSSNILEYQQITLGEKIDSLIIVKSGLDENDAVIYEGLQKVKAGDSIVPIMKQLN